MVSRSYVDAPPAAPLPAGWKFVKEVNAGYSEAVKRVAADSSGAFTFVKSAPVGSSAHASLMTQVANTAKVGAFDRFLLVPVGEVIAEDGWTHVSFACGYPHPQPEPVAVSELLTRLGELPADLCGPSGAATRWRPDRWHLLDEGVALHGLPADLTATLTPLIAEIDFSDTSTLCHGEVVPDNVVQCSHHLWLTDAEWMFAGPAWFDWLSYRIVAGMPLDRDDAPGAAAWVTYYVTAAVERPSRTRWNSQAAQRALSICDRMGWV